MSKTTENLQADFAGESQARNKYTYFAEVARKEGYHYIAKIFEETADNEKRHAKDHLKLLDGIGDTAANLREAFGGERGPRRTRDRAVVGLLWSYDRRRAVLAPPPDARDNDRAQPTVSRTAGRLAPREDPVAGGQAGGTFRRQRGREVR